MGATPAEAGAVPQRPISRWWSSRRLRRREGSFWWRQRPWRKGSCLRGLGSYTQSLLAIQKYSIHMRIQGLGLKTNTRPVRRVAQFVILWIILQPVNYDRSPRLAPLSTTHVEESGSCGGTRISDLQRRQRTQPPEREPEVGRHEPPSATADRRPSPIRPQGPNQRRYKMPLPGITTGNITPSGGPGSQLGELWFLFSLDVEIVRAYATA